MAAIDASAAKVLNAAATRLVARGIWFAKRGMMALSIALDEADAGKLVAAVERWGDTVDLESQTVTGPNGQVLRFSHKDICPLALRPERAGGFDFARRDGVGQHGLKRHARREADLPDVQLMERPGARRLGLKMFEAKRI
jgi:hypothetical protein